MLTPDFLRNVGGFLAFPFMDWHVTDKFLNDESFNSFNAGWLGCRFLQAKSIEG